MRQIADFILGYALACVIVISFSSMLHDVPSSVDEFLISVGAMIAGVLALQMQCEAIEQNSLLTNDPNRANWW